MGTLKVLHEVQYTYAENSPGFQLLSDRSQAAASQAVPLGHRKQASQRVIIRPRITIVFVCPLASSDL